MSKQNYSKIVTKHPLSKQLGNQRLSLFKRYREKVFGGNELIRFIFFETTLMLCGNLQGGIGYLLRKKLLGLFFQKVGSGIIIGKGISLRHPSKISLGCNVAIDDYVLLDAGGAGDQGIVIDDEVIISRSCVIQGKTSSVFIGERSDIGCNTVISSASGIQIGREVLIAANCYLGGAQYVSDRFDIPIMDQGAFFKNSLHVGDGAWLGAGVTVLDGIYIGRGCIVGAGAVVTKDLPDNVIAAGIPAKVIKPR